MVSSSIQVVSEHKDPVADQAVEKQAAGSQNTPPTATADLQPSYSWYLLGRIWEGMKACG